MTRCWLEGGNQKRVFVRIVDFYEMTSQPYRSLLSLIPIRPINAGVEAVAQNSRLGIDRGIIRIRSRQTLRSVVKAIPIRIGLGRVGRVAEFENISGKIP